VESCLFGPFIIERFSEGEIGACEGGGEEATPAALAGQPRRLSPHVSLWLKAKG